MAASIAALDLPDTVVELDLLDGGDAPGEGHVVYVIDGEMLGARQRRAGRRPQKGRKERSTRIDA